MSHINIEKQGHILKIGLDRADKMNAFSTSMIHELEKAYTQLEEDEDLRCAVLYSTSKHFTAGLELNEVGPKVKAGETLFSAERVVN